jgi:hypothetical protein
MSCHRISPLCGAAKLNVFSLQDVSFSVPFRFEPDYVTVLRGGH